MAEAHVMGCECQECMPGIGTQEAAPPGTGAPGVWRLGDLPPKRCPRCDRETHYTCEFSSGYDSCPVHGRVAAVRTKAGQEPSPNDPSPTGS